MVGTIIGVLIGVAVILLGAKGFSADGIPLTNSKKLTGPGAKALGIVCIILGVGFILVSFIPLVASAGRGR
jgi:hypothetical protein